MPLGFASNPSVTNGSFNMQLTGPPEASIVVENSPDLITWSPLQTNTLTADTLQLTIPIGTNQKQFFRARIGP